MWTHDILINVQENLQAGPSPEDVAAYYRGAGMIGGIALGSLIPEGIFTWPVHAFSSQRVFDYVILHELAHWTGAANRLARYGVRDSRERNLFLMTEEIIATCAAVELTAIRNGRLSPDLLWIVMDYLLYSYENSLQLLPLNAHVEKEVDRITTWLRP